MKKRNLYIAWGVLYVFCTVLGFVTPKSGGFYALCMTLSLAFFIPPAILLQWADNRGQKGTVKRIVHLSIVSLVATTITLILNFLTMGASMEAGKILYWLLIILSSPMVCMQIWAISLFLWACLLFAGLSKLKKM